MSHIIAPSEDDAVLHFLDREEALALAHEWFSTERIDRLQPRDMRDGLVPLLKSAPTCTASHHAIVARELFDETLLPATRKRHRWVIEDVTVHRADERSIGLKRLLEDGQVGIAEFDEDEAAGALVAVTKLAAKRNTTSRQAPRLRERRHG